MSAPSGRNPLHRQNRCVTAATDPLSAVLIFVCVTIARMAVTLKTCQKKKKKSFLAASHLNFSNCCEFNKAYLQLSLGNKANAVTSSMK